MSDELDEIVKRYARRNTISLDRYSRLNPSVNFLVQERQRALLRLLADQTITDLASIKVLEVGCGSGGNLLELILLGAKPRNLIGNDLIDDRLRIARECLPADVKLLAGDATQLRLPDESFDMVYQSTVFSSILDNELQAELASKMWRWVRKEGGILWYDFIFNNPRNPDVRGVTLNRVHELFPQGKIYKYKVTLAPPIARRVVKIHPSLYGAFNLLPFLRTHVLCYIKKS